MVKSSLPDEGLVRARNIFSTLHIEYDKRKTDEYEDKIDSVEHNDVFSWRPVVW
jgi:hypothetical protein